MLLSCEDGHSDIESISPEADLVLKQWVRSAPTLYTYVKSDRIGSSGQLKLRTHPTLYLGSAPEYFLDWVHGTTAGLRIKFWRANMARVEEVFLSRCLFTEGS